MRIAIIGTGSVGAALARGLTGKGHEVTLGARHPEETTSLGALQPSRRDLWVAKTSCSTTGRS